MLWRITKSKNALADHVEAGLQTGLGRPGCRPPRDGEARLRDWKDLLEAVGGAGDDMHADELTHAARSGRSSVRRGLHRTDVAADDRRDQSGIDLLPAH